MKLSPEERLRCAKENKLCWNCLKASSHTAKTCKSGNCKTCGKRHNSLLHNEKDKPETEDPVSLSPSTSQQISSLASNVAHTVLPSKTPQIFLSIALANVLDNQGKNQMCRMLLDSGSQSNFITLDLVQRLGLSTESVDISIVGVNQACSKIQKMVQVQISSRCYAYQVNIKCLVVKQITDRILGIPMEKSNFKIPQNLILADPEFYRSTDIFC